MDNARLTECLVRGGVEDLLAVYDAYGDRLYAYGWVLLGDEKQAAAALTDALLVAAATADGLRQPALLGSWLYALTRNECLRRREDPTRPLIPAADEIAELLGRHQLDAAAIAVALGVSAEEVRNRAGAPTQAPDPLPFVVAPADLRDEVLAAAAPDGAVRRTVLARRAKPFNAEGFPVPLDRRRLSSRTLAWSTAVAVVAALGILLMVPVEGDSTSGRALAAVVPLGPGGSAPPVPSLQTSPAAASPITWPASRPGIARSAAAGSAGGQVPATDTATPLTSSPTTAAAVPTTAAATGPVATVTVGEAGISSGEPSGVASATSTAAPVTVTSGYSVSSVSCSGQWSARVWARVDGVAGSDVHSAEAIWQDGAGNIGKAALQHGTHWTGTLGRLPVNRQVVWSVNVTLADGRVVTSASQSMSYYCTGG